MSLLLEGLYHPSPQSSTCVHATCVWHPLSQDRGPSQPGFRDLQRSSWEGVSGSLPPATTVLPGAPLFPASFPALPAPLLSLLGNGGAVNTGTMVFECWLRSALQLRGLGQITPPF